jgi:hypothetical protein
MASEIPLRFDGDVVERGGSRPFKQDIKLPAPISSSRSSNIRSRVAGSVRVNKELSFLFWKVSKFMNCCNNRNHQTAVNLSGNMPQGPASVPEHMVQFGTGAVAGLGIAGLG